MESYILNLQKYKSLVYRKFNYEKFILDPK